MISANCTLEGTIRVSGGSNNRQGRVELCSGGLWGTVCHNYWDTSDAMVVCRQLGYSSVGMMHNEETEMYSVIIILIVLPYA